MRSSRAFQESDLLEDIDTTIRDSMSDIINIELTNESWTQASLPVRSNGLGIRKSSDIALPCFISSAISANALVEAILLSVPDLAPFEVSTEVEVWKTKGQGLVEPDGESSFSQRAWDTPHIELVQKTCLRLQINFQEHAYWQHHNRNPGPGYRLSLSLA